jgi:hypothetical protein
VSTGDAAVAPREQGWRGPLLALLLVMLLPAVPPFQLALPVDRVFVLLAPALAACAVVGWRRGGRLPLAVAWTVIGGWVVWTSVAAGGAFALLVGGWSVLLAASAAGVLLSGWGDRFLPRALLAVGIALALGALAVVAAGGGVASTLTVLTEELARRTELARSTWIEFTGTAQWTEFLAGTPNAARLAEGMDLQFRVLPQLGRLLLPALLALESLTALALAWALYHRFGRARLGPPLAPLRELRFHDGFVWCIVAGLLAVVAPVPGVLFALGMNLLAFAGVLYALRGVGVMLWFLSPGRWATVLLTVVLLLFPHIVGVVAAGIGLGDTWLDWRRRPRPKSQRSE